MKQSKTAIIDIGSNTVRLVIYKEQGSAIEEFRNVKAPLRLRRFLDAESEMSDEGVQMLLEALKNFREVLDYYDVTKVECTATAAVRQAANRDVIIEKVKKETGFHIRLLSGEEEASYGLSAVLKTMPADNGLTIDIGGGSTEITLFENRKLKHSFSFPFGVVSLKEQFIAEDRMKPKEQKKMAEYIQTELKKFTWLEKAPDGVIAAIGGSARNLANVQQLKENYPPLGVHGYELTVEALDQLRTELSPLSYSEFEKVDGLSNERADLILPAIEVFYQLAIHTKAKGLLVSSRGLRDGIVLERIKNGTGETAADVKRNGIKRLLTVYGHDTKHHYQMMKLTEKMLRGFEQEGIIEVTDKDRFIIEQSAALFYLGEYISSSSKSRHTFYLLINSLFDGFTHWEKAYISLTASFTNNSTLKQYLEGFNGWFSKDEIQKMREYGSLLKLCFSLNSSKRSIVSDLNVKRKNDCIVITVYCEGSELAEHYQSDKQKRHLEKALQTTIEMEFKRNEVN
ncbi:Ppx/GppA family phosphatase [Domibacillus sp. A3M-37]|uniref:Ppx/GppA family phosphatase n=1 Tax=Domibacillus sp. A3M-37 TaxID=2962037 RepID=UPI0020B74269|nr:Ppx/GppA family phosphatase [Domibacillus sp. A3M-37]MCP3761832.1 Ppx/GppA family phosphatase [Domibacillus sp. A3M-37]